MWESFNGAHITNGHRELLLRRISIVPTNVCSFTSLASSEGFFAESAPVPSNAAVVALVDRHRVEYRPVRVIWLLVTSRNGFFVQPRRGRQYGRVPVDENTSLLTTAPKWN